MRKKERHGMTKTPAYKVWAAMIRRCHNKNDTGFKHYGGRGIEVCKKWRLSFVAFWKDMGDSYKKGLTLERKNNERGYYKRNCYWATYLVQGGNKRNNKIIKTPWGRMYMTQAARKAGMLEVTLRKRIERKWPQALWFLPINSTARYYGKR